MDYSNDDVEKAGVHFVESKFFGKSEIKTFFKSGDKDDIIDGHLFYEGRHKFNVQIKSSRNEENAQISRKYIESAQTQDLIYFYCPCIFENNHKLYYKIFNKTEIVENPMYLNMGQTISVRKCNFEEFEYTNFIEKLDFFVEQNLHTNIVDSYIYLNDIISEGKTNIKVKINPLAFNDMEVSAIKTMMEYNGFIYNVAPNDEFKCYLIPENYDMEIEIDGEKLKYKKSIDAVGNIRFSFKNVTIDFIVASHSKPYCDVNYFIECFNILEYEEINKIIKFLKKIGNINDDKSIASIQTTLTIAKEFVNWLRGTNLYELAKKLEINEVNQLFEDYKYFSCLSKNELSFTFLKTSTDKFIACINTDMIYNIKYLIYVGNGAEKPINLNYLILLVICNDDDLIIHLLKSINIELENDLIKFLKGEELEDNENFDNISVIENAIPIYSTFILSVIKVYIYSKNKEIYTLLLDRLEKEIDDDIFFINYIQFKKHADTKIETKEYERLESILDNADNEQIKLCCLILLNNYKQESVFNNLSGEEKIEFRKYPIFKLCNFKDYDEQ